MKRFLVFAGDHYYPCGGWSDYYGAYDTIEEARAAKLAARDNYDWSEIVDLSILQTVEVGPAK